MSYTPVMSTTCIRKERHLLRWNIRCTYQSGGYFLSHALNTANTYVVRLVDPSGRGFEHAWRFRVESRTMAESTKMSNGKRNSMMITVKSSQLKNITSDNFRFYNASFEIVYDQAAAEWKAGTTMFQRRGSSPPAEAMCDDCTKGSALRCSASFIGDGVCDSGFNHPEYYFMANERRGCDMTCYSSYNARLNRCIRRELGANALILQADGGDCTVDCQHKVFIDKELKGVGDGHCDVGYNGEPDLSCFRSRNVQDRQPMLLSIVRQQGETPFDLAGRVLNQITLDGGDCYGVADKRNTVIKGLPWSERYDRSCSIPHKSPSFGRLSLTGRYYFDHATLRPHTTPLSMPSARTARRRWRRTSPRVASTASRTTSLTPRRHAVRECDQVCVGVRMLRARRSSMHDHTGCRLGQRLIGAAGVHRNAMLRGARQRRRVLPQDSHGEQRQLCRSRRHALQWQ